MLLFKFIPCVQVSLTWPQFHANDVLVRLRWIAESRNVRTEQVEVFYSAPLHTTSLTVTVSKLLKEIHRLTEQHWLKCRVFPWTQCSSCASRRHWDVQTPSDCLCADWVTLSGLCSLCEVSESRRSWEERFMTAWARARHTRGRAGGWLAWAQRRRCGRKDVMIYKAGGFIMNVRMDNNWQTLCLLLEGLFWVKIYGMPGFCTHLHSLLPTIAYLSIVIVRLCLLL